MKRQTVVSKKRRGPPATGKGTPIVVRLQPDQLAALDAYIARQPEPKPSRPEAIRRVMMGAISRKPDWPDMST
jgi:hypothetical protein